VFRIDFRISGCCHTTRALACLSLLTIQLTGISMFIIIIIIIRRRSLASRVGEWVALEREPRLGPNIRRSVIVSFDVV
jgi:hypothetical protein